MGEAEGGGCAERCGDRARGEGGARFSWNIRVAGSRYIVYVSTSREFQDGCGDADKFGGHGYGCRCEADPVL